MYGVFVGRMCPPHKGHQRVIQTMIDDCGLENCLVMLGSSNAPLSWRVLFPYKKRSVWLKRLFPGLRIIGIPDTVLPTDNEWLMYVDDYISAVFPDAMSTITSHKVEKNVTYYGGSREDIIWFYENGKRNCKVVDRGELMVSATKVRQMLLNGMPIDEVIDKRIAKEVKESFESLIERLDNLGGR